MSFIYSVAKSVDKHKIVKIEAKLNKGLPRVSIIGMPEASSKKMLLKVKSAIINQGFKWSIPKHLVLSLAPSVGAKEGELLELGLAVSILQELGQLKIISDQKVVAAGVLNLEGELLELKAKEKGISFVQGELWLGNISEEGGSCGRSLSLKKLSSLNNLSDKPADLLQEINLWIPYAKRVENLSPGWVEFFEVLVHGEHSCMLLMPDSPEIRDFLSVLRDSLNKLDLSRAGGVRLVEGERPFVQINSAVTRSQILGSVGSGFYHHAHGGLAYLDHFSGVGRAVRDAIRSKLQDGGMLVGEQAKTILIARNPLCPCGKAKLGKPRKCGFSLYKCRSVLEKLSFDEFALFQIVIAPVKSFFELYPHPDVDLEVLNRRKRTAHETQKKRRQFEANAQLGLFDLKEMMSDEAKTLAYIPVVNGLDRSQAVLSVARSLADLEGGFSIEKEHVEKAVVLAYKAAKEISKAF